MEAEEAYNDIASEGLHVFGAESWDRIIIRYMIGEKMVRSKVSKIYNEKEFRAARVAPFNVAIKATKAALFLRDDLLRATGERIWGLTMTIDKNGTFNIEYSYDKPDGY